MIVKAVTLSPTEVWALMTGAVRYMAYSRKTTHRGDMLIGAYALTEPAAEVYVSFYRKQMVEGLEHPSLWGARFNDGAYFAIGRLVKIVPARMVELTDVERFLLPEKNWLYVFENVQALDEPLVCAQDAGIREYDLDNLKPTRYPLDQEHAAALYALCETMERRARNGTRSDNLLNGHFILLPAHEKLRKRLLKPNKGHYLLRRAVWRQVLKEAFPDYQPEGVT